MTEVVGTNEGSLGRLVGALDPLLNQRPRKEGELALAGALAEIDVWMANKSLKQLAWRKAWPSLRDDVERAESTLGARLTAAMKGQLDRFWEEVEVLDQERPLSPKRQAVRDRTHALLRRLEQPEVAQAAWDDILQAVREGRDAPQLAVALDNLHEVLTTAGHDAHETVKQLRGVANGSPLHLWQTGKQLGTEVADEPPEPGERAGEPPAARLRLCRQLLGQPPLSGHCVVWFAFSRADIRQPVIELGALTLLMAGWAVPNALREDGQDFPGREELSEERWMEDALGAVQGEGAENRVVLARIDLGHRHAVGAEDAGKTTALAVVDAAAHQVDGADWREHGWSMLLVNGRCVSARAYVPDHEHSQWESPYQGLRTARALEERGAEIADAVATKGLPSHLRESLHSLMSARYADPRTLAVLSDRVLEMIAAHWNLDNPLELIQPLESLWPEAHLRNRIVNTVHRCLDWGRRDPHTQSAVNEIQQEVCSVEADGTIVTHLDSVVEHRARLLQILGDRAEGLAAATELGLLTDPNRYLQAHDQAKSLAAQLQARQRRVRNAVLHGNPLTDEAAKSVSSFSRYLANSSWDWALRSFVDETDIIEQARSALTNQTRRLDAIRAGARLIDVLADE